MRVILYIANDKKIQYSSSPPYKKTQNVPFDIAFVWRDDDDNDAPAQRTIDKRKVHPFLSIIYARIREKIKRMEKGEWIEYILALFIFWFDGFLYIQKWAFALARPKKYITLSDIKWYRIHYMRVVR